MATTLGEAFIPIRATLDKLDGDLAKAKSKVDTTMGKITDGLGQAGKLALVGIAGGIVAVTGAVAGVLATTIGPASDLNETVSKVGVVFGKSADEVLAFGKTSATALGMSENAALAATGTYGNLFRAMGMTEDKSADMSVNLVKLAGDLASFNNLDPTEVMEKLRSGLSGETEPLKSLGVNINAVTLEAKMMQLGFKKVNGQFTASEKAQASYALIMEQTKLAQGDFARTSGGLANQQRILAAQFENTKATIGTALLPIVTMATKAFNDLLNDPAVQAGIQTLVDGIVSIGETIQKLITDFQTGAAEGTGFIGKLQEPFNSFMAFMRDNWQPIIVGVLTALGVAIGVFVYTTVIPAAIAMIASLAPIVLPIIAIAAIVAVLYKAWTTNWGGIQDTLTKFWTGTGNPIFTQLKTWLSVNIPIAIGILEDFWNNVLLPAMTDVWNWMSTTLIPFVRDTLIPFIRDRATEAIKNLSEFWNNVLLPAIQAVWSWMSTTLIPFVRDVLIPFIKDKATAAIKNLSDFWTNTLLPAITTAYNFFNEHILPVIQDVIDIAGKLGNIALTALAGIWENVLLPAITKAYNYFNDNILPILVKVKDFIVNDIGPKVSWFTDNVIKPLTSAVGTGLVNAFDWVKQRLDELKKLLDNFKLPDWMQPGSPTPLEIGLRGISSALKELNSIAAGGSLFGNSPQFQFAGLEEDATSAGLGTSYSSTTNVYTNRDPMQVLRASRHLDKLGALA